MRGLGAEQRSVGRVRVDRSGALRHVVRGWLRVGRVGCGREEMAGIGAADVNLHLDDLDGVRGAGLHAGGGLAGPEPLVAHVALPHDAEPLVVFRHIVGALQNAVLAADALVIEVADDAGDRILFVRQDGASVEATRVRAVVAGGGDGLLVRGGARAADHQPDIAPGFRLVEAVEGMAGHHAGLATGAGIQIHLERVLFARAGGSEGNELRAERGPQNTRLALVIGPAGRDDRGLQPALLGEQFVHEGEERGLLAGSDHYFEWEL